MNEDIKRDRSPNYPKVPLEQAVEMVAGLYKKAGKSQIRPEVAVSALGYGGMNGAALTALGVLNQYGLIDRPRGEGVSVSQLALRLIHPVNDDQSASAKRESSLKPRVFIELVTGGFHHCAEDLIANHLIQEGFTQDGAKKAAAVFKANVEYANLDDKSIKLDSEQNLTQSVDQYETASPTFVRPYDKSNLPSDASSQFVQLKGKSVLAKYSVPIGASEVDIIFTGEALHPDDFDALADYVALFKKQYQRKIESAALEAIVSGMADA